MSKRIMGAAAVAAAGSLGAYAAVFTSKPAGSGVAVPVVSSFIVVFLASLTLSAWAAARDRKREAAADRRIEQIRAEGQRAADLSAERDRRARASEKRTHSVYAAMVYLYGSYGAEPPTPAKERRRLQAVLDGAQRNASRAEIAEAQRRYRQLGHKRIWFGGYFS